MLHSLRVQSRSPIHSKNVKKLSVHQINFVIYSKEMLETAILEQDLEM